MLASFKQPSRVGWIMLSAAMVVATVFLFWLQRGLAFDGDSINWLALSGTSPAKALIEPYGGHLIFVPLLIYKATIAVAGTHYVAFTVVQITMLLILAALVYVFGKRRVGPLLGLLGPIVLLFLGSSWNVLTQPMIGIQFLSALVFGLAGLLAFERSSRRGDIAACALLTLATFSFEMGLAFVVGVGVGVVLSDERRRRAWIAAVPAAAYLIWRLWASQYPFEVLHLANLLWLPAYAVDSFGVIVVSLFGLFFLVGGGQLTSLKFFGFDINRFGEGLVLFVFEALAVLYVIRRLRRHGPIPATFWIAVAMLVTIWLEQTLALAPDRTPGEIRYILPDTVFFLFVALEAARGVRATPQALAAGTAIALAVVVGNLARFKEGRDILAEYSAPANAAITVLQLGGTNVPAAFNPYEDAKEAFSPDYGPFMEAWKIQKIVAELGSPAYSAAELAKQAEWVRTSADIVAVRALGLHTTPAIGSCQARPAGGGWVTLPRGGATIVANRSSPLFVRRFATGPGVEVGTIGAGPPVGLRIPGDGSAIPWRLRAPEATRLRLCPL